MASLPVSSSAADQESSPAYLRILGNPWLDRALAIVASVPFVYFGYQRYKHGGINLPLVVLWIELAMLILRWWFAGRRRE
jgi:hypothetical protein